MTKIKQDVQQAAGTDPHPAIDMPAPDTLTRRQVRVSGARRVRAHAFQEAIRDTFLGVRKAPMRSDEVRSQQFSSTDADDGVYDKW